VTWALRAVAIERGEVGADDDDDEDPAA